MIFNRNKVVTGLPDEDGVVVEEDGAGNFVLGVNPADARHQFGVLLVGVSGSEAKKRLRLLETN
jgi:hypothetical protein